MSDKPTNVEITDKSEIGGEMSETARDLAKKYGMQGHGDCSRKWIDSRIQQIRADEREKLAQQFAIAGMLRENLSDQLATARARIRELEEQLEHMIDCAESKYRPNLNEETK